MIDCNHSPTHCCHNVSKISFHLSYKARIFKICIQKLYTQNCVLKIGLLQFKPPKWKNQETLTFMKERPHNHSSENQKEKPCPDDDWHILGILLFLATTSNCYFVHRCHHRQYFEIWNIPEISFVLLQAVSFLSFSTSFVNHRQLVLVLLVWLYYGS